MGGGRVRLKGQTSKERDKLKDVVTVSDRDLNQTETHSLRPEWNCDTS